MFAHQELIGFAAAPAAALVTTLIGGGVGTAIGDMTSNGGLAAGFDGTTSQALASCARSPGSTPRGHIGKDWGSGNSKIITKFDVYGPNNLWFEGANNSVQIALYGSNSPPSSWTGTDFGGTLLHNTASLAAAGNSYVYTKTVADGIITTTAYRYHWVMIRATAGSNETYCAELRFYEDI